MMRPPITILTLALLAVPAGAADPAGRAYAIGGFERIRIDGPFRVELTLGKPPAARIDGVAEASDRIDLRVEGDTLVVRGGSGLWEERARAQAQGAAAAFGTIRIAVPTLRAASLVGGGLLTITGPLKGQRVDLALTGSGGLTATGVAADELNATVIGSGTMTLAGRAARVRLNSNGTTRTLAAGLVAGDLSVNSNGAGETFAQARYTASVFAAGVGAVTVYGKPTCRVNRNVQGPVSCGVLPAP